MRQELCQIKAVIIVIVWDPGQNICQPLPGIYIQGSTASEQGVHYGCILCRIMIATEHVIFSTQSQWTDTVLHKIVIDLVTAIKMIPV
jgi:hypothetical protein